MADESSAETLLSRVLGYESKLMALDATHDSGVTSDQWDELREIMSSPERKASSRELHERLGKHIQLASELEYEVGALVQGFTVPDDPMADADFVHSLKAFDRTKFLRKFLKSVGAGRQWKQLFNAIDSEAVFRNQLAHGTWSNHQIQADGAIEAGWFLYNRKKAPDGVWMLQSQHVTVEIFEERGQRVRFLCATVAAVRVDIIARKLSTGMNSLPLDVSRAIETYPFDLGWREDWYQALTEEIFARTKKRRARTSE